MACADHDSDCGCRGLKMEMLQLNCRASWDLHCGDYCYGVEINFRLSIWYSFVA